MSGRELADRGVLALVLVVVWVLLWGSAAPTVLVSGALLAVVSIAVVRLPSLPMVAFPRPLLLPRVLGAFVVDLVRASASVAWAAVRRGPATRGAVVRVPVPHAHEVVLTFACNRLSLTPDTLVLQVQRGGDDAEEDVLLVYALPVDGPEDVERARQRVRATIESVVELLGQGRAR